MCSILFFRNYVTNIVHLFCVSSFKTLAQMNSNAMRRRFKFEIDLQSRPVPIKNQRSVLCNSFQSILYCQIRLFDTGFEATKETPRLYNLVPSNIYDIMKNCFSTLCGLTVKSAKLSRTKIIQLINRCSIAKERLFSSIEKVDSTQRGMGATESYLP